MYTPLQDTSMDLPILLATPKSQAQGVVMQEYSCLSNDYNVEPGFLAKPHWAVVQAVIFVVVSLVKAISIPYETRLESDRLNDRRGNGKSIEVSFLSFYPISSLVKFLRSSCINYTFRFSKFVRLKLEEKS